MARIALSSVVNEQFVNRFVGLASGATDSTSRIQNALSGSATTADFSSALRTGANVYASAVQGFNIGLTFLNFTRDTLGSLREIGEELVTILEQASSGSVGSQELASFQRKFEELGEQFQDLLESGEIGDRQYLSREGLEELFVTLGIDPDQSVEIADIFDTFILADSEDKIQGEDVFALASERIRAPRPVRLQGNVFGKTEATTEYTLSAPTAVTNNAPTTGQLTDVNSIVQLDDPNGSGFQSIQQTSAGSVQGGLVPGLTSDVTLKAVNEATGYSVIESTEDFLGQNGSNFSQLFLADEVGNILHQYTNFVSSVTIDEADISADDLTIVYSYDNGSNTIVDKSTLASTADYGVSAGGTVTNLETAALAEDFRSLKISDNGQYAAFIDSSSTLTLLDGTTADTGASSTINDASYLSFIGDDTVAVIRPGTLFFDIDSITYNSGTITNLVNDDARDTQIAGLQKDSGYIAYRQADSAQVRLVDVSGTNSTVNVSAIVSTTPILSIADNASGGIDVGVITTSGATGQFERTNVQGTMVGTTETIITGDNTLVGYISSNNSAYTDTDNTDNLNYNSGNISLLTKSTGSITTNLPYTITADMTLLDVGISNGYALVKTSQDLLGNGVDTEALFILDQTGRAIAQLNPENSGVTIDEAVFGINASDVFLIYDNAGTATLDYVQFATNGSAFDAEEFHTSGGGSFTELKSEQVGGIFAFRDNGNIHFGSESGGLVFDSQAEFTSKGYTGVYTFLSDTSVAAVKQDGQTQDIVILDAFSLAFSGSSNEISTLAHGLNNVTQLEGREPSVGGEILIAHDQGVSQIIAYENTSGAVRERGKFNYDSSVESIDTLSLQFAADGSLSLGIYGDLSATSGDSDNELYQLNLNETAVAAGQQFSNIIRDFETLFSDERDLRRRPEAAVLLADVEQLLEQIDDNIDVIDNLSDILGDTLTVIRATGTAMLDLSEQINGSEDARDVAQDLQRRIQQQGGSAVFAHGGRLLDVATAALTLNEDSFGDFSEIL